MTRRVARVVGAIVLVGAAAAMARLAMMPSCRTYSAGYAGTYTVCQDFVQRGGALYLTGAVGALVGAATLAWGARDRPTGDADLTAY